jgi:probable HAF family extracellular repeat protein
MARQKSRASWGIRGQQCMMNGLESRVLLSAYTLTIIGPGEANAINDKGQIVGGGNSQPWLYSGGALTMLTQPAGTTGEAVGINSSGQIAVNTSSTVFPNRAYLYTGASKQSLGDFVATGINDSGQVTLTSGPVPYTTSSLYSNGTTQSLPAFYAGGENDATAINNQGQVTGTAGDAFIWSQSSGLHDLGSLGVGASQGNAINDSGQVAGVSLSHAFLYDGSSMTDIGVLPGDRGSMALGMNNAGQVVGASQQNLYLDDLDRAILYSNGQLQDLNTLIPSSSFTLHRATDINNLGQIVGWGVDSQGNTEGFLLNPANLALPDTTPPSALLETAVRVRTNGGAFYKFTVQYNDRHGMDLSSIDSADVTVTSNQPAFSSAVRLLSKTISADGRTVDAFYRLAARGGTWDSSDNGVYTVNIVANQVKDMAGNAIAAGTAKMVRTKNGVPVKGAALIDGQFSVKVAAASSPLAVAVTPSLFSTKSVKSQDDAVWAGS